MTLVEIIIIMCALLNMAASKNGMVTIEVNIPSIFNQLLDINKALNTLRASVGYDGNGSLENSLELVSGNNAEKPDDEIHQRGQEDVKNASDINLLKIHIKGLEGMTSALQSMRRANQLNPDFAYQVNTADYVKKKPSIEIPASVSSALKKLGKVNRKRRQLIRDFNLKFPGLFDVSHRRRAQEKRPMVEYGQGLSKPEIVTYPPNYFSKRLKHLIKLKEKQEKELKEAELFNE